MSPRTSTSDRLRRTALRMFAEQGFDAVPVTEIARAAGVSHMTFFRHFPTKESVVVADMFDPLIAEAVRAQPRRWRPLTRAVRGLVAAMSQEQAREEMSSQEFLERVRLAAGTPSLSAAVRAASQDTERAIAEALIVPGVDDAAARAAAGAIMGAATGLLLAWADGTTSADDAVTALSRGLLTLLGES
ncbi:TetR family transcriptional regulator [Actinomyces sp. ZJ308]|uniref:TetR family transcriptional regulator n=1 Tax=Actinomyces sp. ZJ308 TaxID=2708342 RepID=UPI001FB9FF3D|nr:TetR family transcriptional regulator [Actinomyces sp. ZJ308]